MRRLLPLILCLVGCAPAEVPEPEASSVAASRIVTLAPHLTELVYAAGAGDALIGVVAYSDYPEAALELPVIGDAFRLDMEKLVTLRPDLILAWESGNPPEMRQQLREQGFRVIELEAAGLDQIAEQLREIGMLAGTESVAEAKADEILAELAALDERFAGRPEVSVFYQVGARPLYTLTREHNALQIVERCGGRSIFDDIPGAAAPVDLESVVARDPEVILVAGNTSEPAASDPLVSLWKPWTRMAAVAGDNVYLVEADWLNRSGPRILRGYEQVCETLDQARSRLAEP